jgi:hypothetical protein
MDKEAETTINALLSNNKAINDLVDYLAENDKRLRKVLQQIADKNPFHNQCPPMNDLQYYAQVIVEMVTIANAALKESE